MFSYDDNNIFAKILRGEMKASKVYEDDNVLAFNDIFPVAPVHILVIPKGEYINFAHFCSEASIETVANFFKTVATIADSIEALKDGYRLITNKGEFVGQSVNHFHVHIIGGGKLSSKIADLE